MEMEELGVKISMSHEIGTRYENESKRGGH